MNKYSLLFLETKSLFTTFTPHEKTYVCVKRIPAYTAPRIPKYVKKKTLTSNIRKVHRSGGLYSQESWKRSLRVSYPFKDKLFYRTTPGETWFDEDKTQKLLLTTNLIQNKNKPQLLNLDEDHLYQSEEKDRKFTTRKPCHSKMG